MSLCVAPILLALNLLISLPVSSTKTSWEWEVSANGNNSLPFSFRVVNAEGTEEDLRGGGFYTGQFWVRRKVDNAGPTKPPVTATKTIKLANSSILTSSVVGLASTSDLAPSTPDSAAASSTPSSIRNDITTTDEPETETPSQSPVDRTTNEPSQDPTPPLSSATSEPEENEESSGSQPSIIAIGAGVGAGAAIGITALAVAIWMFCRRQRRKRSEGQQQQYTAPQYMPEMQGSSQIYEAYAPTQNELQAKNTRPQDYGIHEFASKSPVEVSLTRAPFSELAGSNVDTRRT